MEQAAASEFRVCILFLLLSFGWTWLIGWIAVRFQNDEVFHKNIWVFLGIAAFGPTLAAFATYYVFSGRSGVLKLLGRCNPRGLSTPWVLYSCFSMPILLATTCGIYVWFGGDAPHTTPWSFFISLLLSIPVGSLGEEFGWRGVLYPHVLNLLDSYSRALPSHLTHWGLGASSLPLPTDDADYLESLKGPASDRGGVAAVPSVQPWRGAPLLACVVVGVLWALWHLPSFYISALSQNHCNLGQFIIQEILYSCFYATAAHFSNHSIFLAILMHASINSFGGLIPWGTHPSPPFTAMPNSIQTLVMLGAVAALVMVLGVDLGREVGSKCTATRVA